MKLSMLKHLYTGWIKDEFTTILLQKKTRLSQVAQKPLSLLKPLKKA